MSTAEFLAKADALQAKGVMAMFSPDLNLLKGEAIAGIKAWRTQAASPGQKPHACPPPGKLQTDSDDILAMVRAVPPEQRAATSVAEALTTGLNRRYPCPN